VSVATVRRARPLLGTIVEIGVRWPGQGVEVERAIGAAFARIAALQARLSRFEPSSEIGRFNASSAGARIAITADAATVLDAAAKLRDASGGAFDVTLGSGPRHWRVEDACVLVKLADSVRIDLGGIAKGHGVDCAVDCLAAHGIAAGWVNAGGDLRVFGALTLPIDLRDEIRGGVRAFATLADGAFATSRLVAANRQARHASVAAPTCLWADALAKIVIATGDADHPLLGRFGAHGWLHSEHGCLAA
jgi:thiamine biosynthesis lipoprotein